MAMESIPVTAGKRAHEPSRSFHQPLYAEHQLWMARWKVSKIIIKKMIESALNELRM